MKNVLRTAVASVAIASVAISAPAFAATETVDARAEIIAALDIRLDNPLRNSLDFGLIADGGTGGSLTLDPDGTPTCNGGIVCNGPFETPELTLDGEALAWVDLSLQSDTIELIDVDGNTMPVSLNLVDDQLQLDGSGTATFEIGATLTVAANQPVNVYNDQDDFVVVAVYN